MEKEHNFLLRGAKESVRQERAHVALEEDQRPMSSAVNLTREKKRLTRSDSHWEFVEVLKGIMTKPKGASTPMLNSKNQAHKKDRQKIPRYPVLSVRYNPMPSRKRNVFGRTTAT
eukprot:CAMPEP_0115002834 /NCGR_PEP_ID=MMETSP0216-20121206/18241_1 /TAXON_ID=223996 /ORGANISM="Protocruzia adherens, Strain Boccale" /LENGTH=114 /DNA_ID=CAMNT_0002368503 /DNA_START=40 /DNA_END=384 /DNA_ORIENTATION=-